MFSFLSKHQLTASESTRVKTAWGLRFLYQVGLVTSWTIITALFVETFGIQNILWLFAIEAGLYIIGSTLASLVFHRLSLTTYTYMLLSGLGILILLAILFGEVYHHTMGFFVCAFGAKSIFYNQLNIALARRNEQLFSPTEAVKFMPIVESAATIGSVAGAGLLVLSLYVMEASQVLFIWLFVSVGLFSITASLPSILQLLPGLANHKNKKVKKGLFHKSVQESLKLPFLQHIVLFLLLQGMVFTYFDVLLTESVQSEIMEHSKTANHIKNDVSVKHLQASVFEKVGDKIHHAKETGKKAVDYVSEEFIMHETLAHDLGMFHLFFGLLALFVQFFVTSRVLDRFGVVGAIAINAFLVLLSGIGMLLGYMNIKWASAVRHGTHSIGETAYHVSYYSLFTEKREAVRLFLEGMVKPFGVLLTILLMFAFQAAEMTALIPLFSILSLLICIHMKKAYTSLSHHNMVNNQAISRKLHAIEVMGQKGHKNASYLLSQELKKKEEHPLVRQKIIKTLTGVQSSSVLPTYVEILADEGEADEIKIQILDSMLQMKRLKHYLSEHAFSRHHLLEILTQMFGDTKKGHLKKLLVMNIFCHLPSNQVVPFFLKTMKHADEKLQSIYLRSCSVFSDPSLQFYLKGYLDAPVYRIQGHAIIALWKSGDRKMLRKKIKKLLENLNKDALVSGIYSVGEVKEQSFKSSLKDLAVHDDLEVQLHAQIALAKLGDRSAIKPLARFILGDNEKVSGMALGMIERIPSHIRKDVLHQLRKQVSHQVSRILCNKSQCVSIDRLDKKTLFRLKRFYEIVEQFDDLAVIEKALA